MTGDPLTRLEQLVAAATPGPWSAHHLACADVNCDCGYVLTEMYMGAVATVHSAKTEPDGDNPPQDESESNARLIALAPVLARDAVALLRAALEVSQIITIGDVGMNDDGEVRIGVPTAQTLTVALHNQRTATASFLAHLNESLPEEGQDGR